MSSRIPRQLDLCRAVWLYWHVPERRIIKADHHALSLLYDIIDSTTSPLQDQSDVKREIRADLLERDGWSSQVKGEYFIGFEDHFPYGFVGLRALEDCGELTGPYLYRDYIGRNYGRQLLSEAIEKAKLHELTLLFLLAPREAPGAVNFFTRHDFEVLSGDGDFIKRWHDGVLAEREFSDGAVLLVRLLEPED